jgi:hypothetical protein
MSEIQDYIIKETNRSINSLKLYDFDRMSFNFDEEFSKNDLINLIKNNFNQHKKIYNYVFKDGYHTMEHVPNEYLDLESDYWFVEYKFNEDFFRCDNFKKDHDGLHVVFSGCSNTEGIGSNIEDTWSHMIYSDLSKITKTSGYFNLAKGGAGTQNIVSNFTKYVEKFGAPDLLMILHPNILRNYRWKQQKQKWEFDQESPANSAGKEFEEYYNKYLNEILNWIVEWNLFIKYCESIGTKIICCTWDAKEEKNIIEMELFRDTFLPLPAVSQELIKEFCPDGKCGKGMINARDVHPGKIFHKNVYNVFWNELKARGIVND